MILTNKYLYYIIPIILAGCSSNQNNDVEKLPDVVRITKEIPYHIVRDGDTVGNIAEKYGMSRAEIIKLNNLTPPYQLYNGQRLIVKERPDISSGSIDNGSIVVKNNLSSNNQTNTDSIEQKNIQLSQENSGSINNNTNEKTLEGMEEISISPSQNNISQENDKKQQGSSLSLGDYTWPIDGAKNKITQKFKESSEDDGMIFKTSVGTPVRAIADGIVKVSKVPDGDASAYGLTIVIKHDNKNKLSVYSHLQDSNVKPNQHVSKGQIIGKVGKSGKAKSPQLYLEIFDTSGKNRKSIDPFSILP